MGNLYIDGKTPVIQWVQGLINAMRPRPRVTLKCDGDSYQEETGLPYGKIVWHRCEPPVGTKITGPWFLSGSYACHADALFDHLTYANSCANVLSLATGTVHGVDHERISLVEMEILGKTSHGYNHRVIRGSQKLSPAAIEALKARLKKL